MANKKKLAVIGYGGMGGFHARTALRSDVVEAAGIFDIDPARMQKAREDGLNTYESLEAVLADPTVEIVTVATPNDHHKEIAIAALNAGKNVICEKPVAMNSAELEAMIAAAKRNGKLFTVHQNRRWDTDKITVAELVASGSIGQVASIESRVHGSRGIPGDWRKVKAEGGGMVLDWGVHLIDQAIMIFKDVKITSVYARLEYITGCEVDDGCHIVMTFENGAAYTVEVGTSNFIYLPRFYVRGSQGSAIIREWNAPLEVVIKKDAIEKDAVPIRAQSGITKTMAPRDGDTTITYEIAMPTSDVHDFYRNFCRAIDGLEEQIVTHDEMRRVMKVMELAFRSAESGQVIHEVF